MITRGNPWAAEARRNPYPFVDTASLQDSTGLLKLSPVWITDAKLWPALDTPSRIYLSSIERTTFALVFTVSSLDTTVGTAVVTDLTKKRVAIRASSGAVIGFLGFSPGGLQAIHDVPSRVYQFPVGATEFIADVLALQASAGLRSIGDGQGGALTSKFSIVGGEGVILSKGSLGTLRIDVIGDPYYRRVSCEDATALGKALKVIRGVYYKDMSTGVAGVAKPFAGNISTVVIPANMDPKARGFTAPGPDLTVLARIGA